MTIAVISDVHANAVALRAVLEDMAPLAPEQIVCLGDLVGRSTQVQQTLQLIRSHVIPSVYGDHDMMALGTLPTDGCDPNSVKALHVARKVLTPEERAYLLRLPSCIRLSRDLLFLHSCFGDPSRRLQRLDDYVQEFGVLQRQEPRLKVCFTGHTHVPRVVEIRPDGSGRVRDGARVSLRPDCGYFLNPGSVGDPGGGDTRATYALYDPQTSTVSIRRVAYNPGAVMRENARHGIGVCLGTGQAPAWAAPGRSAAGRLARAP